MSTHILLLESFQFIQMRCELILAEGVHLAIIEICLFQQFAQPPIKKHLANICLATQ